MHFVNPSTRMLTSTSCDFFFSIRPTDLTSGNTFDATPKKNRGGGGEWPYLNFSACIISDKGIVQQMFTFFLHVPCSSQFMQNILMVYLKIVPKAHVILVLNLRLTGRPLL